jgi:hypothetical protein
LKYLLIIATLFSFHSYGQNFKNPFVTNYPKLSGQFRKVKNAEMWERNVQYLGNYRDTITIQRISDSRYPIGDNRILIEDSLSKNYSFYANGKLKVVVDTSQNVTLEEYEWWTKKENINTRHILFSFLTILTVRQLLVMVLMFLCCLKH